MSAAGNVEYVEAVPMSALLLHATQHRNAREEW